MANSDVTMKTMTDPEISVMIWKMKQVIKELQSAVADGDSFVSIAVSSLNLAKEFLDNEYLAAPSIQASRSIEAAQKLLASESDRVSGLCLFTGIAVTDEGDRKFDICIRPFVPLSTSLCHLDNQFHVEAMEELLEELLESDGAGKFGFIVMDVNETLFATLRGNTIRIIDRFIARDFSEAFYGGELGRHFSVSAPRDVSRRYLEQISERASQAFIDPATLELNVSGLILAEHMVCDGQLSLKCRFERRLDDGILKVVKLLHGGERALHQAINMCPEILGRVRLMVEKKILREFSDAISQATGDVVNCVVGAANTVSAVMMELVHTLIVWEDIDVTRYVLIDTGTGERVVKYLSREEAVDQDNFRNPVTEARLEVLRKTSLINHLLENTPRTRIRLEIVGNTSSEGSEFCEDFGIGAILRGAVPPSEFDDNRWDFDNNRWDCDDNRWD